MPGISAKPVNYMALNEHTLQQALHTTTAYLLARRNNVGYWEGYLSSSALSTATAISALALAHNTDDCPLISRGVSWLLRTQNADGGWGDSETSPSNLATTLLVISALRLSTLPATDALSLADGYLLQQTRAQPGDLVAAVRAVYGADRTFAVPILMNCALAGLVRWEEIPGLPFHLALLPQRWYRTLKLHVVSYALPALIAIGLLLHAKHHARNILRPCFDACVIPTVLSRLAALQPSRGGFLEATPLTSFVAMSLLAYGATELPVTRHCLDFLRAAQRDDGSWPIDTNLSVWVTSTAMSALLHAQALSVEDANTLRQWLLAQQYTSMHHFTQALPGGWGWTHLPGGVPDADDTAGAIIALSLLGEDQGIAQGVNWLLALQNDDGGWPTFCRGWGQLPFDKSSPDITAHSLRALQAANLPTSTSIEQATTRGFQYLQQVQQSDGSWIPLWFGNQQAEKHQNPVLGAARVLLAYAAFKRRDKCALHGVQYLLAAQQSDGGWGGDARCPSSVEETALAISALTEWLEIPTVDVALAQGITYLLRRIEEGSWTQPAPIGLYFASLWYSEQLYPIVWTIEALARTKEKLNSIRQFPAERP